MAAELCMPSLGADMDEGTVLEWKVAPGQAFAKGDVVLEVDTDKAAFEVEADHDGVMGAILVQPGTTVPVGTVLARLQGATEGKKSAPESRSGDHAQGEEQRPGHRPRISPRARKRARELGVDIGAIGRGTGVDGSIDVADVEAAAIAPPESRAGGRSHQEREESRAGGRSHQEGEESQSGDRSRGQGAGTRQARLRSVIAAAMSRSKREIPHYYLGHTFDLEPALAWLERENRERPITQRILPNVLLLKAIADGLDTVPELNGYWIDGAFQQQEAVHLGVAIALRGGGVIAPALHDMQDKPLDQVMAELSDLVRRARAGKLRHREMTDGTITATSLGDRGTDTVLGVIFPPQVALVGFGTVAVRPWVVDGQTLPRRVVTATLSADHRASDGHRGALFLRAVADRLQEPETL